MAMQSRSHEIICENQWDPWEIKKPSAETEGCMVFCSNDKDASAQMILKLSFRSSLHSFSFFFGKDFLSHTDEVRGYLDRFITLDVFHAFFKRE